MKKTLILVLFFLYTFLVKAQNERFEAKEFVDSKGTRYYSWENLTDIPKSRYTKLEIFTMWADARISAPTLDEITTEINKQALATLNEKEPEKKQKQVTAITFLCEEINRRARYAIPPDVLINMAALLVVREDENPDQFSEKIQEEKYQQFVADKNAGHTFFLTFPIFNKLHPQLIGIDQQPTQLLSKWERDIQQQKDRLMTISSFTESKSTKKKNES
jgi:hypothetical protein